MAKIKFFTNGLPTQPVEPGTIGLDLSTGCSYINWTGNADGWAETGSIISQVRPGVLVASVNNYNPGTALVYILTSDGGGPYNITGLALPGGNANRKVTIHNANAVETIMLTGEDVGSLPANRFKAAVSITGLRAIDAVYDNTALRWFLF